MKATKKSIRFAVRMLTIFITIIIFIPILYTIINADSIEQSTLAQIQSYGIPALILISLILDLVPQMLSPAMALAAAIIVGIPVMLSVPATILGSTVGSIAGFILGKKYMFKAVDVLTTKQSTRKLTELTNKYGKIIVPLAAISPLPYLPVVFGAMNFSKRNFVIYGLLPRAIGIIIYGLIINIF